MVRVLELVRRAVGQARLVGRGEASGGCKGAVERRNSGLACVQQRAAEGGELSLKY